MTSGSAPDEVKAAADTLLSMIDADVKALEGAMREAAVGRPSGRHS